MLTLILSTMITLTPASCETPNLPYRESIRCGLTLLDVQGKAWLACEHLERAHELDLDASIRDTEKYSVDYCF